MAEAKNSFIKSKMNKDLDERLIPNNEYRDALNIAVSRSDGSDVGAVESILGNSITDVAESSGFTIIGVYADEGNNRLYYFKTDHSDCSIKAPLSATCTIGYLETSTNNEIVLVQGSFLNFCSGSRMNGISLIENQLFFTDNRNQPRKINVDQSLGYYTNEDHISVAKFAPYSPPSFLNLRADASEQASPYTGVILPSTMSDASDPDIITLGVNKISSSNLAVKKYKNGDLIPEATSITAWQDANTAQEGRWCYYANYNGNGVTYGLLYNKWAVVDVRGLAPIGHRIPTLSEWTQLFNSQGGTSGEAQKYKSQFLWDTNPGTDLLGFNSLPSGERIDSATVDGFQNLTTLAGYWTSDAYDSGNPNANPIIKFEDIITNIDITQTAPTINGYAVRVLRDDNYNGWNGDPDYLSEKFVKFSYRFKFDDNEYSVVAPFSQDVFIPYQDGQFVNNDENNAFVSSVVEFMQNSINNAVLNIPLPCIDIITKYKVKAIDIIFKQSDTQSYQVIESIKVDSNFISLLNNTNIYQYSYESTLPTKTLPASQSTRVYDKVPVRALAQETTGNRIMYSNYLQGYSAPKGLDYYVDVDNKSAQEFIQYPQHSVKQNRNYQVGVVLADKYGRQTDVILSNYDGLLDSSGNPQPGSNFYSPYNPASFGGSIQPWTGDNLALYYLQQIPEEVDAGGISGYPGSYAFGNYYEVNGDPVAPGALYAFFNSSGTQCIIPTANQTLFDTIILYADATDASNTFNVYVDSGNGWILQDPSTTPPTYTIADSSNNVDVTFNVGLTVNQVAKFEVLYTSNNYYKYRTGAASSTLRPLFPSWPADYAQYYSIGKKLKGLYIDYTEIKLVTPITDANGVRAVDFFTEEQVATNYLFDNTPDATRPEPNKAGIVAYATYDINVNGFYCYKFAVKQQQQDYYNVYLPGIINGYPITGETKEQNSIAFTTLISDNINKIPRNLQSVGPLQDQFTSDTFLFGRVTNILEVASTSTVPYSTYNRQYVPSASADKVDLIGTVSDLFPGLVAGTTDGEINEYSIYNYNTKPYITQISTRTAIGIKENQYTAPALGDGNYPYPSDMGLAVYETSPFVSALELFYESSTSDLISDLNESIINETTNITGISNFTSSFPESATLGTIITTDFFPTSSGVNLVNTTLSSYVVNNHFDSGPNFGTLDVNNPRTNDFIIESGSSTGSYRIKTQARFYAGSSSEIGSFVDQRGRYLFTITFAQSDGILVSQTLTLQLENSIPDVPGARLNVSANVTPSNVSIVNPNPPTGSSTIVQSNLGDNGSARKSSLGDSSPTGKTFNLFPPNGNAWTVEKITKTNLASGNQTIVTGSNIPNYVLTAAGTTNSPSFQGGNDPDLVGFALSGATLTGGVKPMNESNHSYLINMHLTDTLGLVNTNSTISYQVGTNLQFVGQVICCPYTSGNRTGTFPSSQWAGTNGTASRSSSITTPVWNGQIENWTTQKVYIYMQVSASNGTGFFSCTNLTGKFGDGTNGTFTGADGVTANAVLNDSSITSSSTLTGGGSSGQLLQIGSLQAFSAAAGSSSWTQSAFEQAIINGLRPGQKNTTTGYDYSGGVQLGIGAKFAAAASGVNGYTINISWSHVANAGASDINPMLKITTDPPFYPNLQAYPTTTPVPDGPV